MKDAYTEVKQKIEAQTKIVSERVNQVKKDVEEVDKQISESSSNVTKAKTEIDTFAKNLKTAYETTKKRESEELQTWKSDKANVFIKTVENDSKSFEQKFQTKMLSSIVKSGESLVEEVKTIAEKPIP